MYRSLLTAVALLWAGNAIAGDVASLVVREAKGDVRVTAAGREQRPKAGDSFVPPVQFRTGADGAALIAQGETTVRIAPSSVIAIPAGASPSTIDKVLQQVGGALYNVKSRNGKPFSVETPYLTSVVKGTLFSITVQNEEATVALLEGSLEVGGRGSDTVLLGSGDTARLKSGGARVAVERARDARAPAGGPAGTTAGSSGFAVAPDAVNEAPAGVDTDLARFSAGFRPRTTVAVGAPAGANPPALPVVSAPVSSTAPVATVPPPSAAVVPAPAAAAPIVSPPVAAVPAATPPAAPVATPPAATPPAVVVVVSPPVVTLPPAVPPVVPVPVIPEMDDGNNGHGNDAEGSDSSNSGKGGGGRKKKN